MIPQLIDLLGKTLFTALLLFTYTSPITAVYFTLMDIPIYGGDITPLVLHAATGVFLVFSVLMAVIFALSMRK